MQPARNVELKARIADLAFARTTAERLATEYLGVEHQRDTYFTCPRGRLKLREIEGRPAQLIYYERPDQAAAKASDYRLIEIVDAGALRDLLDSALGVTVIVEKNREILLYHNVRIHLDEVRRLGTFIEFEAVVGDAVNDTTAHEQVAWLQTQFHIDPTDLLSNSYGDMLLQRTSGRMGELE
jgi:predicted adenylyl cyclase CyaB